MEEHPLRRYRHEAGLTLDDVAAKAETTKETLCRIELGVRSPSLALASRLSKVTGLALDNFAPQTEAAE